MSVVRKVATFAGKELADRFAVFLSSKGIESSTDYDMDESGSNVDCDEGVRVWIEDGRFREQAKKLLVEFLAEKDSDSMLANYQKTKQVQSKQPKNEPVTERIQVGSTLAEAPATIFLMLTCVVIYLFINAPGANRFEVQLMFIPELIYGRAEIWRIFAPMVTHKSFFHALFNIYWLYRLGLIFEWNFGTGRMLKLAGAVAFCSHTLFYVFVGPNFLGASGLIYALVGYLWAAEWSGSGFRLEQDMQLGRFFLFWYVFSLGLSLVSPSSFAVANIIHAVGAAVGIFAAFYSYLRVNWIKKEWRSNPDLRRNLAIGLGLFVAAFLVDSFH